MERVHLIPVLSFIHSRAECGGEVVPYAAITRKDEETGETESLHRCKTCSQEMWVDVDSILRNEEVIGMADRPAPPRVDEHESDEVLF